MGKHTNLARNGQVTRTERLDAPASAMMGQVNDPELVEARASLAAVKSELDHQNTLMVALQKRSAELETANATLTAAAQTQEVRLQKLEDNNTELATKTEQLESALAKAEKDLEAALAKAEKDLESALAKAEKNQQAPVKKTAPKAKKATSKAKKIEAESDESD